MDETQNTTGESAPATGWNVRYVLSAAAFVLGMFMLVAGVASRSDGWNEVAPLVIAFAIVTAVGLLGMVRTRRARGTRSAGRCSVC